MADQNATGDSQLAQPTCQSVKIVTEDNAT
jgi:hypothetical protein